MRWTGARVGGYLFFGTGPVAVPKGSEGPEKTEGEGRLRGRRKTLNINTTQFPSPVLRRRGVLYRGARGGAPTDPRTQDLPRKEGVFDTGPLGPCCCCCFLYP